MDGRNTRFLLGWPIFRGKLLVLGRVLAFSSGLSLEHWKLFLYTSIGPPRKIAIMSMSASETPYCRFDPQKAYLDVSKNNGIPKSSILIGFSLINHPFWGTPIFGNTHISLIFFRKPWTKSFFHFIKLRKMKKKSAKAIAYLVFALPCPLCGLKGWEILGTDGCWLRGLQARGCNPKSFQTKIEIWTCSLEKGENLIKIIHICKASRVGFLKWWCFGKLITQLFIWIFVGYSIYIWLYMRIFVAECFLSHRP